LEASISNFLQFNPDIQARIVLTPPPYLDGPLETRHPAVIGDFLASVLDHHGIDPKPIGVPYGTDASLFAAAGLNCVVMGPGDIAQAHTSDEWIELEQLERACSVFRDIALTPVPKTGCGQ
jgi:acetylornithine deacetylase